MQVQVFYSYHLYDERNTLFGFGSGAKQGEKEKVWHLVMDDICEERKCSYENIHLISFNTI